MIVIPNETLYRKVLMSDEECMEVLIWLDLEIICCRQALANTNDTVLRRHYMTKLKHFGAVADRIRYSEKERVEV